MKTLFIYYLYNKMTQNRTN